LIIAVAKVLFSDSGYHDVAVDEIAGQRESYIEASLSRPDDFDSVLLRMAHVYADSIERDPYYLKMEIHSVLGGEKSTQQLFESRWKSFSDYIEVSMIELASEGIVNQVNPYSASPMFQGLMRELLYAKCIYFTEKYQDIALKTLVDQQVSLFLSAVEFKQSN